MPCIRQAPASPPISEFRRCPAARSETARDTVRLQARSGRDVTSVWVDLALAALEIVPPHTVLDSEAVIYAHGRIDFAAPWSRALSIPRCLAEDLPTHFAHGVRRDSSAAVRAVTG